MVIRKRVVLVFAVAFVALAGTALVALRQHGRGVVAARWVGTWAAAQHAAAATGLARDGFDNQTIRMTVRTSVGGDAARFRLSNVFGARPLVLGDMTVATPADRDTAAVRPETLHDVTFGGRRSVTVLPGEQQLSDPVEMVVPALGRLTVSLWLPTATGPATFHTVSRATSYIGRGNHTADGSDGGFTEISVANPVPGNTDSPWFYLAGVDVRNGDAAGSVVVFGDSISDGWKSSLRADHRWPDRLAERLAGRPDGSRVTGVLNEALSGNSLGHDAARVPQLGPNAIARLRRDVLGQTGVRTVIVQVGINDLLIWGDTAPAIVGGLRQVAGQLHEGGLRVVVCTLTPWKGWPGWTEARDKVRLDVNAYLRSTRDFDGVIDLDALLRDVDEPNHLTGRFDSGDHLHPNDAGYLAIADSIPLDELVPERS